MISSSIIPTTISVETSKQYYFTDSTKESTMNGIVTLGEYNLKETYDGIDPVLLENPIQNQGTYNSNNKNVPPIKEVNSTIISKEGKENDRSNSHMNTAKWNLEYWKSKTEFMFGIFPYIIDISLETSKVTVQSTNYPEIGEKPKFQFGHIWVKFWNFCRIAYVKFLYSESMYICT